MWQWLASFLTGPIIGAAINAYKAKLAAGNDAARIAADLAGRELLVQQREIEVEGQYKTAMLGHWAEPTNLFGFIMVGYFAKAILWDKVLSPIILGYPGSTDPITGDLATWAGMIMLFFVGKRGFENVARILRR